MKSPTDERNAQINERNTSIGDLLVSSFMLSPRGSALLDPKGYLIAINTSALNFFKSFGFTPEKDGLLCDSFLDEHKDIFKTKVDSVVKNKKCHFEVHLENLKQYWLIELTYQKDEILGDRILIVFKDKTRIKSLERVFQKLLYMASFTKNLITISDANLNLTFANESFLAMTGYEGDEVIGKNVANMLKGKKTSKKILDFIDKQLSKGLPYRIEILDYKKNGESFWQNLEVVPLKDDDEIVIGYMSIGQDITEEKEKDKKIESLLDDLKSVSAKSKKKKQKTNVKLTKREEEILSLIKLGFNNTKIGYNLGISTRTAEKHRQNIFIKYRVKNTVELLLLV